MGQTINIHKTVVIQTCGGLKHGGCGGNETYTPVSVPSENCGKSTLLLACSVGGCGGNETYTPALLASPALLLLAT